MKYIIRFIDTIRNLFKPKRKEIAVRHAADNEYDYNRSRTDKQKELDRILDKINQYGKESLTKAERNFLNNIHGL